MNQRETDWRHSLKRGREGTFSPPSDKIWSLERARREKVILECTSCFSTSIQDWIHVILNWWLSFYMVYKSKLIPEPANFNATEQQSGRFTILDEHPSSCRCLFCFSACKKSHLSCINHYLNTKEWRPTSISNFPFFPPSKSPSNDQSLDVDQRAPRSRRVQYVRCYFAESPIFLLIRWNKHIHQRNFQSAGRCFCYREEISFVPEPYKENQSRSTSMIFNPRAKKENAQQLFECTCLCICASVLRVKSSERVTEEDAVSGRQIKGAEHLPVIRAPTRPWARTVSRYRVRTRLERRPETHGTGEMCQLARIWDGTNTWHRKTKKKKKGLLWVLYRTLKYVLSQKKHV